MNLDNPETQPIVEKVLRKVKTLVPVKPVANKTLITDFYDLTNDEPETELEVNPALINDFYDEPDSEWEVTPAVTSDLYDLTNDDPEPAVTPNLTVKNCLKRKINFCEAVSPKRKSSNEFEEEYFTQSVFDQIDFLETTKKSDESQIFFDKTEISPNFDLG